MAATPTIDMKDLENKLEKLEKETAAASPGAKRRVKPIRVHRASFHPQNPVRLPGRGPQVGQSAQSDQYEIHAIAVRLPVWPESAERGPEQMLVPHLLIMPKLESARAEHEPVLVPMSAVTDWEPLDEELLEKEAKARGTTGLRAVMPGRGG